MSAAVPPLTPEQRFRDSDGLQRIADRGLYWSLDTGTPGWAMCETPPGEPRQQVEFIDVDPFAAAMRMIDSVLASDMRSIRVCPVVGLRQLEIEVASE